MRYVATGRVHPERADISFDPVSWRVGGAGRVVAQCDSSQVSVLLDLPDLDGWITAHVAAEHFAQIVVGALGFSLGSGYTVEIIQITEQDGTPHVFGVRPNGKQPGETLGFTNQLEVFNRALLLASENVFFRLALRDFLRAVVDTWDCASYCYRAIESIKGAFDGWEPMHFALHTERKSIEEHIKAYADPIRHGNWAAAKQTDRYIRWQMLCLTRDILAKYLDYAKPTPGTAGRSDP